ncbi:putative N-acetyl-LL-diaminopimelate aminotransferase [Caloramator mitchellensis]|uniref:Aminotransferase n=1 Tax=Caloramator mitchellensis TaxID=908809 RepID=A0A0R3K2L6_CALMK|nr:aminotransferase A [Caloramator mitchellensis]KRQ87221.1 putative N-acetyl-LL-diaminopimelate aminotransferase [Caloramator mitchellensis]
MNKRLKEIQISGIRRFYNLVSQYKDAISLTIGQPDFPTPEHVKVAAKLALDNNKTVYTNNAGIIELRRAISNYYKKYGLNYNPEDEVIVTNGASEGIYLALNTILEVGDEVILPGPIYPGYEPVIKLCGAVPVFVDTTNNGFKLTAESIKDKLSSKTKCIIIPTPSNPTGVVLSYDELSKIASLVSNKDIFIVSDEIYSELVYDFEHTSIASFKEVFDNTIVINGLSKSHSMTGFRIGYTLAPKYITCEMIKLHQYINSCASSIGQYAALEALTNGLDDASPMREEYKKRRDFVYKRLIEIGFDVIKPNGAFYIFPSIKKFGLSSLDFATKLLESEKVAVVPGDAFSHLGEGYIRISYASSMDTLEEGLNRIGIFLKKL